MTSDTPPELPKEKKETASWKKAAYWIIGLVVLFVVYGLATDYGEKEAAKIETAHLARVEAKAAADQAKKERLAAEKAKAEALEKEKQAELQAQARAEYDELMAQGQKALDDQDWEKADSFFLQAQMVKNIGETQAKKAMDQGWIAEIMQEKDVAQIFLRAQIEQSADPAQIVQAKSLPDQFRLGHGAADARLAKAWPQAVQAERQNQKEALALRQFSTTWTGKLKHRGLERMIKEAMNDPGSYKHAETVYKVDKDHVLVITTFRGKNAFGGMVVNHAMAKFDFAGNYLDGFTIE